VAIDWAETDPRYTHRRRPDTYTARYCGSFRTSMPPLFRRAFTPSAGGKTTSRAHRSTT
jgi:hypothetical protein